MFKYKNIDTRIITASNIAVLLDCGQTTAKKYYRDIKRENNLINKPVTYHHFYTYLNIDY